MNNVYCAIEKLLNDKRITRKELEEATGISRSLLTELKAGRTKRPSADSLKKIATYLNVTTDHLLNENKNNITNEKENEQMTRLIEFDTIQKGLHSYFFSTRDSLSFLSESSSFIIDRGFNIVGWADKALNELINKTKISKERFDQFLELALCPDERKIAKSLYPKSHEFDTMMFAYRCDKKDAIILKERLDEEYRLLIKIKESQDIDPYGEIRVSGN